MSDAKKYREEILRPPTFVCLSFEARVRAEGGLLIKLNDPGDRFSSTGQWLTMSNVTDEELQCFGAWLARTFGDPGS